MGCVRFLIDFLKRLMKPRANDNDDVGFCFFFKFLIDIFYTI